MLHAALTKARLVRSGADEADDRSWRRTLSSTTEDVHYLTEQARKCFRLARLCNDDTVAERLRELGHEFAMRAIALGADPHLFPKLD
jgi:DNA-binding ferritin-like protein